MPTDIITDKGRLEEIGKCLSDKVGLPKLPTPTRAYVSFHQDNTGINYSAIPMDDAQKPSPIPDETTLYSTRGIQVLATDDGDGSGNATGSINVNESHMKSVGYPGRGPIIESVGGNDSSVVDGQDKASSSKALRAIDCFRRPMS